MTRLVPLSLLLVACPAPTEPPPEVPTAVTDLPPATPVVEVCDADPASLPFRPTWSPIVYAPPTLVGSQQTFAGTFRVPSDLAEVADPVQVYGVDATVTDLVDDGTEITGSYTATVTCPGTCRWIELTVGDLLLQAPTPDVVDLSTTALMALDVSRGVAAARNGASGLEPGMRPDLDAVVPDVVAALRAEVLANGGTGVAPGGAPVPSSAPFAAVEDALADPTLDTPDLPETAAAWKLHTLTVPDGARLVTWDGSQVSVPLEGDASGQASFLAPQAATTEHDLVFRFAWADGRQSAAHVMTRGPQSPPPPPFSVSGTEGDAVAVSGGAAGDWVLVRSTTTDVTAACLADDAGSATLTVDRTSGFVVAELADDLSVVGLASCGWEAGAPVCSP